MRGESERQPSLFYCIEVERRLPREHPLRQIKEVVDRVLGDLSPVLEEAYSRLGRPSIPPERLLKALVLQALYSIRSERQLVDAINFNLLYRWFCDMEADEPVWDATTFTKNRQRFEGHGLLGHFFQAVVAEARFGQLMSGDHFSVDGTLIASWASLKSLRPHQSSARRVSEGSEDDDGGNPTLNWRGERRSNATHRSLTDPQARLARKGPGQPALLAHGGHVLMDNRHGLCVDIRITEANGWAEREAALAMLDELRAQGRAPKSLAADAGYDAGPFLRALEEERGITPYVPIRSSPIVGQNPDAQARRRARHRLCQPDYGLSQRARKRVEEIFGWMKTIGGLARVRHVGRWKIQQCAYITAAAYNLLRMAKLQPAAA